MISRSLILKLKGHTVQVKYRTSGKKIARTMTGTIKSIGIRNVHVETLRTGREYRIPIQSVSSINEVSA